MLKGECTPHIQSFKSSQNKFQAFTAAIISDDLTFKIKKAESTNKMFILNIDSVNSDFGEVLTST